MDDKRKPLGTGPGEEYGLPLDDETPDLAFVAGCAAAVALIVLALLAYAGGAWLHHLVQSW